MLLGAVVGNLEWSWISGEVPKEVCVRLRLLSASIVVQGTEGQGICALQVLWQPPFGVAEDRNVGLPLAGLPHEQGWQPPSGVAEDRNYIDGYAYTAAVLDYDKMYRPLAEASTIPSSE